MNKNVMKNLIISVLVALTFFQTIKLWFDDSSGRPFLYSFFQKDIPTTQSESIAKLVTPYRIITNISDDETDKRFAIQYNGLATSSLKKAGDNVIEQVLKKGDYIGSFSYSPAAIDRPYIEYEYAFSMPSDIFVQRFSQKSTIFTGRVKQFDTVIIIPNDENNHLSVLFADKTANNYHKYSLPKTDAGQELLTEIETTKTSDNSLYYKPNVIDESSFIYPAFWNGSFYEYKNLTASNPYGEITLANVERFVNPFFDNPAVKQFQIKGGVYTYSDEKTVVYYYPNDVLKYSVRQYFSDDVVSSFVSSFSVAMNILSKDKTITNDFYLSSYKQDQNGFSFSFNYCVNDFPLYFSQNLRTATGMDNMIEIKVAKDYAEYKRYISSYETSGIVSYATNDFDSALESVSAIIFSEVSEPSDDEIKKFDFGYKIDADSDILYLSWFIDMNGNTFVQSTE